LPRPIGRLDCIIKQQGTQPKSCLSSQTLVWPTLSWQHTCNTGTPWHFEKQ
jgi:hypothetical protein